MDKLLRPVVTEEGISREYSEQVANHVPDTQDLSEWGNNRKK
jgi:hypothetical protein